MGSNPIISSMKCPNCKNDVDVQGPPERGPSGGDWWICIKCPQIICTSCYTTHIAEKHPEMYEVGYTAKKDKKHRK